MSHFFVYLSSPCTWIKKNANYFILIFHFSCIRSNKMHFVFYILIDCAFLRPPWSYLECIRCTIEVILNVSVVHCHEFACSDRFIQSNSFPGYRMTATRALLVRRNHLKSWKTWTCPLSTVHGASEESTQKCPWRLLL